MQNNMDGNINFHEDLEKTHINSPMDSDDDLKVTMPLSRTALMEDIVIRKYAQLEVIDLKKEPFCLDLDQEEFVVGREADCNLQIPSDGVSRKHSRIFYNREEYYIEDLDSTNGTYVNGIAVVKCVLRSNDQIEIGKVRLIFVETEARSK